MTRSFPLEQVGVPLRPGKIYALPRVITARSRGYLIAIRDAAVYLASRGPLSVTEEIRTGDVVDADFGVAQAGEVLLSHVSARAIEVVCLLMVDSLDREKLM
jgi:hypothetical protein